MKIDQEMLELFETECRENLELVEESLLKLEESPQDGERLNELFRGLHTLKGISNMLDFVEMGRLAHAAEDLAGLFRDEGASLTREGLDLLFRVVDNLREMADEAVSSGGKSPGSRAGGLVDELHSFCERLRQGSSGESALDGGNGEKQFGFGLEDEFFSDGDEKDMNDEDLGVFLQFLEKEFPRLQKALEEAAATGAWNGVEKSSDIMEYAARQLGLEEFSRRLGVLKEISRRAMEGMAPAARELEALEQAIVQEILVLKELGEEKGISAGPSEKDLSSLFVKRIVTDSEAMNARLRECSNAIRDLISLISQGEETEIDSTFPGEALDALRLLYHFAVFYDLNGAGEALLIFEDLYSRIGQGELAVDGRLPDLTDEFTDLMQEAFEAIRERRTVDGAIFQSFLQRLRDFVAGLPENQVAGVSSSFIRLLDVSPGLVEVTTPESNARIGEAFKKGEFFYEITVDLDSNPDVAGPFMALQDDSRLTFITSETIFEGDRSIYNFLVSSNMAESELNGLLKEVLGRDAFISLRQCRLRENGEGGGLACVGAAGGGAGSETKDEREYRGLARRGDGFEEERADHALEAANKAMEEITAISGTIHHIVTGLEHLDFEELITGVMAQGRDKKGLETLLSLLRNLVDVDKYLSGALEELQDNMEALNTIPAGEFLEWIALSMRNIATAQGLAVRIEIGATDARIQRSLAVKLRPYMKKLLRKCIGPCSTEDPRVSVITIGAESRGETILISIETGMDARCHADALNQMIPQELHIVVEAHERGVSLGLPSPNALVNGIVVRKGGMNFVIPVKAVKRIIEPVDGDIVSTSCDDGYRFLRIEGELVCIRPITSGTFDKDGRAPEGCGPNGGRGGHGLMVVVEETGGGLAALEVDDVLGQEQLRVTPLTGHLRGIPGASGCAILGNGDVGVVIVAG